MGEHRQIRSRSWNMPTKRCSAANSVMDEFIVVDDDEVIILDFPESSKCKAASTSRTRNESILQRVINIDDDDDDDVEGNVHKADEGTSSRNSLGVNLQTSAEVDDDDDCQFVQEKCGSSRFSKCTSSGIRYGLGSESESEYSDSDCSDCEILEGSNGEVREQWEEAFLRKSRKASKAGPSEEADPLDQHDRTSSFFPPRYPDGGKETSSSFFGNDGRNTNKSLFGSKTKEDNQSKNHSSSRFFSKDDFAGPSSLSPGIGVEHEKYDSPSTHPDPTHQNSFEKQPDRVQVRCETSQSIKENQKKKAEYQSSTKDVEVEEEEEETSKSSLPPTSDSGARCEDGIASLGELREQTIDPIPSTSGQVKDINATAPAVDIMLGREKMKETDEYKKAQEAEWESRHLQLQIQAEEAQRQRKRRKLENMRQLEMERRQKERVEEVRETQKKDEESMNMKEKVRAEITKSLKLLELKSNNMASLLRGLGVHVGGGTSPLASEVHAAYKRAVLKFHPDRTSRGDIKQQVEAEEKFKLIARMKDKFKSSPFR